MLRAILTLATAVFVTIVAGVVVLTVGLAVPRSWCFYPAFHLWSRAILRAAGVRLTIEGAERLSAERPCFFVGNHQSAMDIPVLAVATRGDVRFIAKKSLFRIPILGWMMAAHGCIPIDRSSPRKAKQSIDQLLRKLARQPESMAIFPEGTRSEDGTVGEFKRGAMQICRRAGLPVVPFAIDGSRNVHVRKTLRVRGGPVRISFGEPIPRQEVEEMRPATLVDRLRNDVERLLGVAVSMTTPPPVAAVTDGCRE